MLFFEQIVDKFIFLSNNYSNPSDVVNMCLT